MKTITKIWDFLDGKKTTIGTVIWAIAGGIRFIPGAEKHGDLLNYISEVGYAIAIGGIGHKGFKFLFNIKK